ncbi:hypothetical protein BJD10_03610 [Xanthomonas hortorum pv. gardneri]|nr:hypothetical protein BJD10_03610 [Xanthomonas hortorum pv. gardneri]
MDEYRVAVAKFSTAPLGSALSPLELDGFLYPSSAGIDRLGIGAISVLAIAHDGFQERRWRRQDVLDCFGGIQPVWNCFFQHQRLPGATDLGQQRVQAADVLFVIGKNQLEAQVQLAGSVGGGGPEGDVVVQFIVLLCLGIGNTGVASQIEAAHLYVVDTLSVQCMGRDGAKHGKRAECPVTETELLGLYVPVSTGIEASELATGHNTAG